MLVAVENVLLQKTKNRNLTALTSVSAHCSPVSNKRHKLHTSTVSLTSSCSSQMNNNHTTGIDMNSLEDMLRKVRSFTIFVLISFRSFGVVKFVKWCVAMCTSPNERVENDGSKKKRDTISHRQSVACNYCETRARVIKTGFTEIQNYYSLRHTFISNVRRNEDNFQQQREMCVFLFSISFRCRRIVTFHLHHCHFNVCHRHNMPSISLFVCILHVNVN